MRLTPSDESIFLLALSTFLLILILLFSFLILVPKMQNYRTQDIKLQEITSTLNTYKKIKQQLSLSLEKSKITNQHLLAALKQDFDIEVFYNKYKNYFKTMQICKEKSPKEYDLYDINTILDKSSYKIFYNFIDSINKSKWIIKIDTPIRLKRDTKNDIDISFSIKVYLPSQSHL